MRSRNHVPAGLLALAALANGQDAARTPTPNDTLKSIEIQPDNRVTFRIYAPKASEVRVTGDWLQDRRGSVLHKSDEGVWSLTEGPLVPDFYSYSYLVDGVRTVDPKNAMVKQGISSVDSMFELPGKEAEYEALRPVPHGEVRAVWYQSKTLDTLRRLHIYTPPGYDSGRDKYPVFYLLHGGGDEDSGWSTIGRAGFILDNLLAEKKTRPMIVVMPNGSLPPGRSTTGVPAEQFAQELLNDIDPFVEKNYRVLTGRENRAIAGLSMGGGHTIVAVFRNPDRFGYVGIWSSGFGPQLNADMEKSSPAFFEADKTNKLVRLIWIGVGKTDPLAYNSAKNLTELLNSHGIKNEYHESDGGHTWINWRQYLNQYAQLLFK